MIRTLTAVLIGLMLGIALLFIQQKFYSTDAIELTATELLINELEERREKSPEIYETYIALSEAYLQYVRETADTSVYETIVGLMQKAKELRSAEEPEILAIEAAVASGRHDFKEAEDLIKRAIAKNPDRAFYHGLLGDVQLELGRYSEAVASYQKMVDISPDFSSYSRIAFIREYAGDIAGAERALERALEAGAAYPENLAWAQVELGKPIMRRNLSSAEYHFQTALDLTPGYAPALAEIAKVNFFKGKTEEALSFAQQAEASLPVAEYAILTGDIYKSLGEYQKAAAQYTLAELAYDSSEKAGINTDLERAQFLSGRTLRPADAIASAKNAVTVRPNIIAFDTLAWSFYQSAQYDQADRYIRQALELGGGWGSNLPQVLFHAGMIARELGDEARAKEFLERAYTLHPYFSILEIKILQRTLSEL